MNRDDATPLARRFAPALVAIVLVALLVRLAFALLLAFELPPASDSRLYRDVGERLAEGLGYTTSRALPTMSPGPTAGHPPALALFLAGLDVVGLTTWTAHRIGLGLVGALGVGLLGLAGRRLGGAAIGLGAALIGALHPLWLQHAGMVVSEALYLPVLAGLVLLGARAIDRPSVGRFAALGGLLGVAILVRSEAVLLVPLLGLLAVLLAKAPWRRRGLAAAAVLVTCALVVAPWLIRNAVVFDTIVLSTNRGATLAGSNCGPTYRGPLKGGFDVQCARGAAGAVILLMKPPPGQSWNEASIDARLVDVSSGWARRHAAELPGVVAARLVRTWSLYRPDAQLRYDVAEGRHRQVQRLGFVVHWVLLLLAVLGAVLLPRAWWRRWALLAGPVAAAVVTAATVYGSTRMRTMAEPSITLFAAAGLALGARRVLGRARPAPAGQAVAPVEVAERPRAPAHTG